ncbi:signal recognition particle protein [Candidatus Pacearchaeota archaeon]|nr:signal recognition particle protein [Candidatus Pacearchaeota archaeon]
MVLEKLSETLKNGMKKISNAIFVDKKLIDSIIKDLQRSLIEADVNVELVFNLSKQIREIAVDETVKGIEKKEQLVKLIHDQLELLIGKGKELKLDKKTKILLLGLYGSGKTTTISKLAFYYSKRGKKVCALGLDTQRPAAMKQLKDMCDKAKVTAFVNEKEKDPLKIIKQYQAEMEEYDIILIDTAGRDTLKDDLIDEIKSIEKKLKPTYRILVIPADIGQAAKKQASEFQKALSIDGVIITRMDGTARAGGALTACAETNAPVFFIGTGEKIQELETFDSTAFISRLLGMGDLAGLLEKVRSAVDEKQQEKMEARLKEGKFTLHDLYSQLESMGQLGNFDKLIGMLPGMGNAAGKIPKAELEKQENKMKHWKYAIQSMTKEEVENPILFDKQTSRIQRVSKGSGTTTGEIRELLKQYKMINELMKSQSSMEGLQSGQLDKKTMMKMAKKFRGKIKI